MGGEKGRKEKMRGKEEGMTDEWEDLFVMLETQAAELTDKQRYFVGFSLH